MVGAQSILRSPEYPSIAEVSVYVDEAHRSRTVGAALFVELHHRAKRLGFRSLVSLTFEKNRPSLRGLEAAGFRRVGVLAEVAWLRDRWESVVWLQKDLDGRLDRRAVGSAACAGASPGPRPVSA